MGDQEEVHESLAGGLDPNVLTPAQGAPPIFYASCCDFFGKATLGSGDAGRLQVLEMLAGHPAVDLDLKGTAMWAEGQTIYDLVALGRCPGVAVDALTRGRDALISLKSKGTFNPSSTATRTRHRSLLFCRSG